MQAGLLCTVCHPVFAQRDAVRTAQQARWPQAQSIQIDREGRCWEIEFVHEGQKMEAIWMKDGTLFSINQPMALDQVPEPVRQAIGHKWPRVREAERLDRTSGPPLYELDLQGDRKRWFTPEGQAHRRPCPPCRSKRLPTSGWMD